MPRKRREPVTRCYRWEGDPCRIHTDETGSETADIYRGGKGLLPVSPTDVQFKSVQIGLAEYEELVTEEEELFERSKAVDACA